MLIQSLERGFAVIKIIESTRDMDILVCKDLLEVKQNKYMLICLKNPDLVYRTMPLFTEQRNNSSFSDFVECFSQNGNFHLVFRYHEKESLYHRLEEEQYSLRERLEIAKSLLSKMTLQNMPQNIQYEALQPKNLLLDDSLRVFFNYILEEISVYNIVSEARLQTETASILRTLFDEEVVKKSCPLLEELIERLERGDYKTYLEIYQDYDKVYTYMQRLLNEGELQPQSFWFRLWEKIKKIAKIAKPIFATVVVGAVFIYLLYSIGTPAAVPASASSTAIHQIGTVVIEEGN